MTENIVNATQFDKELGQKNMSGLRSPNLFAKHPAIAWILFILGMLLFGALTWNLYAHGPLLALDTKIANTWPAMALRGPAYTEAAMAAGFYIGDQVILGIAVILAIYFFSKRYWQELAMVLAGLMGSSALFLSLSTLIGRARPASQIWIIEKIPGFPSGHSITVVVFYVLLAYLLVPKMRSGFGKALVIVIALLIILYVGFSRVFTGGHYLTDVLAGYSLGIAWSGAAYGLIENDFKRRRGLNLKRE